jgi:alkylhydroperoxidase/carboxymuconolactone decarboxylase family protein YurZ
MREIDEGSWGADLSHMRERGIGAYARIFDVPEKDVPAAMADRVGPVFAEEALLAAGGPAWSSPALTGRERSMVIITALAAQGVAGDRLDRHWRPAVWPRRRTCSAPRRRAALALGVPPERISMIAAGPNPPGGVRPAARNYTTGITGHPVREFPPKVRPRVATAVASVRGRLAPRLDQRDPGLTCVGWARRRGYSRGTG